MSNKPSSFERCWRILEYLRWNTDAEHPVRGLSAIREDCKTSPELASCIRQKDTFKSAVWNMANVLNGDANGHMLPQDQWRIVYGAYLDQYGADSEDADLPEDEGEDVAQGKQSQKRKVSPPVKDLYYQHVFSYQEIDDLIEGVLFSRTLSTGQATHLVKKIEENLTTKFYPKGPKSICKVRETVPVNWSQLRGNLLLIQRAIDNGVKIAFQFNGYDRNKKLVPVREKKDIVSPYYCVAYGGRYYLLACQEKQRETGPERRMSIWRIDLMSEIKCLEERALKKKEVTGLPQEWDDTFLFHHLNMSFDQPIPITLRIVNPWTGQDGESWTNYTFLMDWFGDSFRYERTDEDGDIVHVTCSPFGMVNWALQYSDRVEVLEPPEVREAVVEKIRGLNKKYGVEK